MSHCPEDEKVALLRQCVCFGTYDQLRDALLRYNGDVNRAANYILTPPSDPPPSPHRAERPSAASAPILEVLEVAILDASRAILMMEADAPTPSLSPRYHPDLDNGDCLFHCMWTILATLATPAVAPASNPILVRDGAAGAKLLRELICSYIEREWFDVSAISGSTWCEMVTMQHETALSVDEAETHGSWGHTDESRMEAWKAQRNDMYGSPVEATAFVELLQRRGIPLCVRIWRRDHNRILRIDSIRPRGPSCPSLVADVHHTGGLDTSRAHYRLVSGSSFVHSSRKRRRHSAGEGPRRGPSTSSSS